MTFGSNAPKKSSNFLCGLFLSLLVNPIGHRFLSCEPLWNACLDGRNDVLVSVLAPEIHDHLETRVSALSFGPSLLDLLGEAIEFLLRQPCYSFTSTFDFGTPALL